MVYFFSRLKFKELTRGSVVWNKLWFALQASHGEQIQMYTVAYRMVNKCYGIYNTNSSMHILWKNLTSNRGDIHVVQYLYG